MTNSNLEQLQKLSKFINTDSIITNTQIEDVLKAIIQILSNNKREIQTVNSETKQQATDLFNKVVELAHQLQTQVDEKMGMSKSEMDSKMSQMMADCRMLIEEAKMMMPADGQDGKDADEEKVITEVLAKIKLPEQQIFTGEIIVNKINGLEIEPDKQIDAVHIKNLPKEVNKHVISTQRITDYFDETTLVITNPTQIKFQGSGVQISQASDGALIVTISGGSGSATFEDQTMTDSGDHTAFTITNTPTAGTLLVINENTGQAVPSSAYSNVATTITFTTSQQVDDGVGNLVTPTFRARYSH